MGIRMIAIPQLTLIAVAGNRQGETIAAFYKCLKHIKPSKCVLLTNIDITATGIECINVGGLDTWAEYNRFVVKELYRYFDTSHCLIIQHDGYVIDGNCWDDEFLDFDIIGARGLSDGRPNYNGGFSLRSAVFQHIIAKDNFIEITAPEDEILCRLYRSYLEETHHVKYCTDEVADKFAYELHEPVQPTFGFHAFHHEKFRETIVVKRSGALGDVIMAEPVLSYFYEQGYHVALDTQEQFRMIYSQHHFPVIPITHVNPKLKCRVIDLDMCYEVKPKRPVLESYFEMAGIKNVPLRNSRLSMRAGDNEKLFKKYAVIHIDKTGMPYRDVYGINWEKVVWYLEGHGYNVFQIGRRVENEIATYFNTMNIDFMKFFLKGADLFIGLDSGCAQVAVGFNIPSVIFFGSVNPKLRYNNFDRIRVVQSECPKKKTQHCYHSHVGVVGVDCVYNKELPPCTQYTADQVIKAVKELV